MSDNTNKSDVLMQPIVIPTIGDAGYADSLNEAFDTINKNFVKLSNHDFVKGDAGVSVKIADYKFFNEDGTLTVFGERLKEFIVNMSDRPDIEQADIKDANEEKVCGLFDYFDANPGSLKMICEWDETEVDPILSPVTSLYYVFMDGRYMGKALSEYERQYENTKDFSCILVYDVDRETGEGKFSSLNNAFPTVYYEKGIGLCWKINGAGSGLPIRGIPGKDGANATLYIVKSTNIEDSIEPGKPTKGVVDGIYESYEGYIPVEDIEDITLLDNQAALILGPKENSADNTFYFGTLALEEVTTEITDEDGNVTTSTEQVLYAYCSSDTSITTGLDTEAFINSMKRINLLDNGTDLSTGIKGLFIPLQSPTADNKQKVHLLTASSITNTEGISNDLKSDVLWTPINDINTLEVNPDKPLQVDKYLYLKVNNKSTVANSFCNIDNIGGNHIISETNYVLKYKLTSILSGGVDRNLPYFDTYNPITASADAVGSRYYGTANIPISDVTTDNLVPLTPENTVVINAEGKEDTNHFASMPSEFYERLNNNLGIYRWVLCDTIHEGWDVSELTDNLASNSETGSSYNFDKRFNTVFTTDLTPGTSSEIMWFNAGEGKAANATNKYVIPGWITNGVLKETDSTDYIFEFIKFVPIYNIYDGESPIKIDNDTALNINYNVNITGDNTNSRRSLTVHGDINCDNINVYELTATRQIHNIYTENDIVGTAGLIIGQKQDPEHPEDPTKTIPGCVIASSGTIDAEGIDVGLVTIKKEGTINAKDITTSSIDTDSITVNYDRTECLYVHKDEQYVNNNNIAIDVNNVGGITVTAGKLTDESTSVVPKITTDMPIQYSNNSNIVITNASIADVSTYIKNASIDTNGGPGVVGNAKDARIDAPSFDHAKNYNIYQLNGSSDEDILDERTVDCRITAASSNPNYMCKIDFPNGYDIKSKTWTIGIDKTNDYDSINLKKTIPYLQACTISLKDGEKFSKNSGITIDFNNPFVFNIGILGTCSNGKWPVFMDSSSMTLKFYYKLSNSDVLHHIPQNDLSYTFDTSKKSGNASNNTNNDNGYEWGGYKDGYNNNSDGVKFNWEKDGWAWTYYTYAFTLKSSIYILPSYFSDLAEDGVDMIEALNNGVDATIYVIPEFKIRFECQGSNKYLINGLNVTVPRPYKNDSTVIPTNVSSKVIRQTKKYVKLKENNIADANLKTSQFKYKVFIGGNNTNTLQSSIICNDGITMIAGKHAFGLGYGYAINHEVQDGYMHPSTDKLVWSKGAFTAEKIPMLYYYDTDVHQSIKESVEKVDKRTEEAYTRRINAIPLKDIFETIQFIREHKAAIEKLGS